MIIDAQGQVCENQSTLTLESSAPLKILRDFKLWFSKEGKQ